MIGTIKQTQLTQNQQVENIIKQPKNNKPASHKYMRSSSLSPNNSRVTSNMLLDNDFMSMNRSAHITKKTYRLNMYDNTLSPEVDKLTKQEEKLKEFIEQDNKDKDRYNKIKDTMMNKFFKIRTSREVKIHKPPLLHMDKSLQISQIDQSFLNVEHKSSLAQNMKLSNKQQINNSITKVLQASQRLALSARSARKRNLKTKSEIDKKHQQQVKQQKKLIMKFIKKSHSVDIVQQKRWQDLSNRQKYLMDFNDYMKKKTKSAIQSDIYQKKIMKKNTKMQKFQDFILQQVKFSADHRQKLTHFFKQIQWEFKRIQTNQKIRNCQFKKKYLNAPLTKRQNK